MHLAETNDFGAALKEFPQKFRYERAILHHLYTHPNDFVNSFRSMPKSLRYIFTHAYQSALFNEIIDERIRQGIGLEPVEGDILSENGIATAALFGFEGKLADGKPGEIEKIVLEKHGLKLSDFNIREFAELSSKGGRKEIMLKAENLKLIKIDNDEYNEGCLKASFSFGLKKGCYATTIMKEIMGNNGRPENNE
jgi:tRNA pseudouridine13 synthase